jgi:GntR family transcriptional activator of glc operon
VDPTVHARLDHAFHLSICEASHNPILVHMLRSLNDLMLSSVYASVNNLYHREPYKKQIDKQHKKLYDAVIKKLPEQASRAASNHVGEVSKNLRELEQEEHRLVRATLRLEGWK